MENSNTFDNWLDLPKPILALAPMADLTDGPFCRVCREVESYKVCKVHKDDCGRFVIFREMVSAEAIVRGNEKTLKMCEFDPIERPIVLQLFGSEPKVIVEAARILVGKGSLDSACEGLARDDSVACVMRPDGIDINMGCPVPKIASRGHAGAYLMREPERAVNIVKALKKANLGVPVSVKTRLGWASEGEILQFAPLLEQAGADALTIHGRTKKQGYSGQANWGMIAKVVKLLSIPVIANGDIKNSEDIKKCLEITGADGVMIGRAALGNPWIFNYVRNTKTTKLRTTEIGIEEIKEVVMRHAELHLERYGDGGMRTFRKHLLYYFKGFDGVVDLRRKLARVNDLNELKEILMNVDRH